MSDYDKNKLYNVKEIIKAMENRKELAEGALKLKLDKYCKGEWVLIHNEMNFWTEKLRMAIHDFE